MTAPTLTLASGSPRRIDLLTPWWPGGLDVRPADLDEQALTEPTDADGSVRRLAAAKAEAIAATGSPQDLVLGADTVVVDTTDTILGKPLDRADAFRTVAAMRGTTISVISGVALAHAGRVDVRSVRTELEVGAPSDAEIRRYVDTGAADDKAGALEVQDRARTFVEAIRGCYPNVLGLPLCICRDLLGPFATARLPDCDHR
ncbi:MAG: hypothetical protein HKN26_09660 [Acidimicrobiales bacterium]|nr:hypothetical protein [Acidimicrobiales bacterium]